MSSIQAVAERPRPHQLSAHGRARPGGRDGHRAGGRLPSLTGLRFPAALCVFLYHAAFMGLFADESLSGSFMDVTAQAGGLGVSFFFVLSGFVLTWSARSTDTPRAFWRRRFVKIYPNYVVTWALALVLFAGATTSAPQAVANLFMLQVWVPDFDVNFGVNPPSWSLGTEAVFYLAFPVLFLGVKRIAEHRLRYWTAGTLATVLLTPVVVELLTSDAPTIPGEDASVTAYWAGYVLPLTRLADFALGILVARLVLAGRWRNIGILPSALLIVVGYVGAEWLPYLYGQRATCIIPVVFLIAATATADVQGRPTPFNNRVMVWLGEVSFAFYLLHFIVLKQGRSWLPDEPFSTPVGVLLVIAAAAVSVLLAWLLYALVERPLTRRFGSVRKTPDREATHV